MNVAGTVGTELLGADSLQSGIRLMELVGFEPTTF